MGVAGRDGEADLGGRGVVLGVVLGVEAGAGGSLMMTGPRSPGEGALDVASDPTTYAVRGTTMAITTSIFSHEPMSRGCLARVGVV